MRAFLITLALLCTAATIGGGTTIRSSLGRTIEAPAVAAAPSAATIDTGTFVASAPFWAGAATPQDTGTFDAASGKLLVTLVFTVRDGGAVCGASSVVVDPGGVAVGLVEHATSYDDTFQCLELWWGVAPSALSGVIARITAVPTSIVTGAFVFVISGADTAAPIGASSQVFTAAPVLSTTLAGCTPNGFALGIAVDATGGLGAVTPFAGNTELFERAAFLAGFVDTIPTVAGAVTVGSADQVGQEVKMAAWEILAL